MRDYKIVTAAAAAPYKGQNMTLDATGPINAHLRPGYMVARDICNDCNTTTDLRARGILSMVANRDE